MKAFLAVACVFLAITKVNAAKPDVLLLSQVVTVGAYGSTNVYSTVTNSYDRHGQRFERVGEIDSDFDGVLDLRTTSAYAYDNRGYLTQIVSRSVWIATGEIYANFTDWFTNDNFGRVTNLLSQSFYADQADPMIWHGSYSYDKKGNLTEILGEWRWGDQSETQINTTTYNARGNITQNFQYTESNLGYRRTILTSYAYDRRGSPSRSTAIFDEPADGVPDGQIETTFDCDRTGAVVGFSNRTLDGSGVTIQSQIATYASDRNVQTYTELTDEGNDGTIDRVLTVTEEYLSRGAAHQN